MATRRRVVEQHEDWLNLTDAEAPWFSLPVLKRTLPNGLDPTPPEVRAEHKARWYGHADVSSGSTRQGPHRLPRLAPARRPRLESRLPDRRRTARRTR